MANQVICPDHISILVIVLPVNFIKCVVAKGSITDGCSEAGIAKHSRQVEVKRRRPSQKGDFSTLSLGQSQRYRLLDMWDFSFVD